jgi:hypothetical protein
MAKVRFGRLPAAELVHCLRLHDTPSASLVATRRVNVSVTAAGRAKMLSALATSWACARVTECGESYRDGGAGGRGRRNRLAT